MTKEKRKELELLGTDWHNSGHAISADTLNNLSVDTLNNLSADTLNNLSADTLNNLSADTLKKIQKTVALATWEKPYTNLLEAIKQPGCSLDMSTWHSCETTHCIAGWTVTRAPGGKELETRFGTECAARMILKVSRPDAPLPRFDGNAPEDAIMAFVEARAAEEK